MTPIEVDEYLKKNDIDPSKIFIRLSRDNKQLGIIRFTDVLKNDPNMLLENYDLKLLDKYKGTGYKTSKGTSELSIGTTIAGTAGTMSATSNPYDLSTDKGRKESRTAKADKEDLEKYPGFATWNRDLGIIGGSLGAGALAALGASYALPTILKVAGQAMTPSTWIGGISKGMGYTVPDLALDIADLTWSGYWANLAGKELDREGLNLNTGINAALSVIPFIKDEGAIDAVANAVRRAKPFITDINLAKNGILNYFSTPITRLGRELNYSVNNTKLVNVPIEHVSTNGITEGAGLNTTSATDVGFHFSPAGSPTTSNILRATGAPFVRTGVWTYSNNTAPVLVKDTGNWTYLFNPEIYAGVNPGTTAFENTLALNSKAPNYTYINNFEGNGALSYMTVEPSQVVLSKNEAAKLITPIKTDTHISSPYESYLTDITFSPNKQSVFGFIGDDLMDISGNNLTIFGEDIVHHNFNNQNDLLKFLSEYHQDYVDNLDPITRLLHLNSKIAPTGKDNNGNRLYITNSEYLQAVKLATLDDIDLFYGSDEYRDRFINLMTKFYKDKGFKYADYLAEGDYDGFLNSLNRVLSRYIPVITGDKSVEGFSNLGTNVLGLSTYNPDYIPNTITHEFGHLTYSDFLNTNDSPISIWSANDILFGDPDSKFLPEALANQPLKLLDYYSDTNELRLQLIPAVKEMFENGWTPEIAYEKANLGDLKTFFPKNYLIKILGGLLSTFPIVNNDKNN